MADCESIDRAAVGDALADLATLFEAAPRFLARLVEERPFGTWTRLFDRARVIAHRLPEPEQIELINAHPRLGAAPATVSAASFFEQGYDGRARIPARLAELNDSYEARFGFRYCVFVAGRPLAALLPDFEAALGRSRDAERERALDAVIDIAAARQAARGAGALDRRVDDHAGPGVERGG